MCDYATVVDGGVDGFFDTAEDLRIDLARQSEFGLDEFG